MIKLLSLLIIISFSLKASCQKFEYYENAKSHYKKSFGQPNTYDPSIDSLIRETDASADFNKTYFATWQIGLAFLEQGKHLISLDIYDKLRIYLESLDDNDTETLKKLSRVYNIIGAIYEETGLWNEALGRYMQSLQICENLEDLTGKARIYNNIGNIYFNKNELVKAEELYKKAIEINKEQNDRSSLFDNYMNLGGIYKLKGDLKKALETSLLALNNLNVDKDHYNLSLLYFNIGNLYQDMGSNLTSLTYYREAVDICIRKSYNVILVDCYLSIASVYQSLNKVDSSRRYITKSLALAESLNNPQEKSKVLLKAAEFYSNIRDFKRSSEYYSAYSNLYDSLVKINSLSKIEHIKAIYEVINKEKDNEILVQQLDIQQLALQRQRILLIGGLLLFLFLIYVLINMQRNRKKEKQKNEYVQQQNEILHQKEKEMLLSKEHNLELQLEFKKRELTLNVMSLMKMNEMLSDIYEKIMSSAKTAQYDETRDVLKKIGREVQKSSEAETLKEFTYRFKEINQEFFELLLAKYPDLTPSELKLCAFLKLNLTTKEISELTGQSVKAIEVARYRLRVKLGITNSDANLVTFMNQFNQAIPAE